MCMYFITGIIIYYTTGILPSVIYFYISESWHTYCLISIKSVGNYAKWSKVKPVFEQYNN